MSSDRSSRAPQQYAWVEKELQRALTPLRMRRDYSRFVPWQFEGVPGTPRAMSRGVAVAQDECEAAPSRCHPVPTGSQAVPGDVILAPRQ